MSSKPVFLWWAHKKVWGLLARHPKWSKMKAVLRIRKMYPDIIIHFPIHGCFACQSSYECRTTEYGAQLDVCKERCPLFWGDDKDCFTYGSTFNKWAEAANKGDHKRAVKYAKMIRDLPLRENAHKLYDVKEHPDD